MATQLRRGEEDSAVGDMPQSMLYGLGSISAIVETTVAERSLGYMYPSLDGSWHGTISSRQGKKK